MPESDVDTRIGYLCPNDFLDFLTVALVVILRGEEKFDILPAYVKSCALDASGGSVSGCWAVAVGSIGRT